MRGASRVLHNDKITKQHAEFHPANYYTSAKTPVTFEPTSMCRKVAKRPDGISVSVWEVGRQVIRGATIVDTVASSHV